LELRCGEVNIHEERSVIVGRILIFEMIPRTRSTDAQHRRDHNGGALRLSWVPKFTQPKRQGRLSESHTAQLKKGAPGDVERGAGAFAISI
jgi:hypothetical protein